MVSSTLFEARKVAGVATETESLLVKNNVKIYVSFFVFGKRPRCELDIEYNKYM